MFLQTGVSCKWISDSQHFLLEHFDIIHDSPSHIYHSALPFCPSSSWLCKYYSAELPQEIEVVKGLPAGWEKSSRTVSLGSHPQDLSYWNNTIAIGSDCGDIIILDAITGSQTTVLSGHTGEINSLTFSSEGKSLVSGSNDKTVKLWDVQTGGVVKTFYGHTSGVWSVSISADCTRIASGSSDNTIRLWNIQTGRCNCVIEQQSNVLNLRFFPKAPQYFLSICQRQVWQWDINGHQVGHIFDSSYIAFSSDGDQFVSCKEEAITVQNSSSGVVVATFQVANKKVHCCCFSPNGNLIAVAADDTIYIWDITNLEPHLIETFVGHTRYINSIAFSSPSSIISASTDQSIKFWQIGAPDLAIADSKSTFPTSAPIMSIALQANNGVTITSDSDGVVRTWDILTGVCKASFQTPARGAHKGDLQLVNGRMILVLHTNGKISTYDVEKGELLLAVNAPHFLEDLRISRDRSRVFYLDMNSIKALSVQTGMVIGEVSVKGHPSLLGSLAVDGSRVWVHYSGPELQGWEFGAPGSLPVQLPNMPLYRPHPNGVILWDIGLSRVKDKVTGKVVFQLPKRYGKPVDVQWNDQYLVACFIPAEVLVLDFSHILL